MLLRCAVKCTITPVAVLTTNLYTFHIYMQTGQFQRTGVSTVSAMARVAGNVRAEIKVWLQLKSHINGAAWYKALCEVFSVTRGTDVSSLGWGGVMRSPSEGSIQVSGRIVRGNGQRAH